MNEDRRLSVDVSEGMPRWVKVFGAIALVLILVFVVLHLTGNTLSGHGVPGVSH